MTPSAPASPDLNALTPLLERQKSLYQKLRILSDQQKAYIDQGQSELLLTLLSQRQKLIDDAASVTAELEPYRQRWEAIWTNLDETNRQKIGALVRQVQELLGLIVQQDERDRQTLVDNKARISNELQKIARGTAANNAYRAISFGARNPNRFTNQQG